MPKSFDVEIGKAECPDAIITVRVVADTRQSIGLTCTHASGADMAGDLMVWTEGDKPISRRHTAWPSPPDCYRIEIGDPSAATGETVVTAIANDSLSVSDSCERWDVYRTAVKLLKELRGEADQHDTWNLDKDIPPRPWNPAPGTALADRMGGGWPDDEPFPLDPDECIALVRGWAVKPRRPFDRQMLYQLPGQWEKTNSWIWLRRT